MSTLGHQIKSSLILILYNRLILAYFRTVTLLHASKDMVESSTGMSIDAGMQSPMTHRVSIGTGISKHSEDELKTDEIPLVRHNAAKGGLFRAGTLDNGDGIAGGESRLLDICVPL